MKKSWLICGGAILVASVAGGLYWFNQNKEEKFVNPLFYKQLAPFALGSKETYLTPTSMKYSNSIIHAKDDKHEDGWTIVPCELLENEDDYIVLKCKDIYWRGEGNHYDIYKYQLDRCFTTNDEGKCTSLYVKEYYYYKEDTSIHGQSTYAVELD